MTRTHWLGLALLLAILLGIGLRFANLDGKVYWYDEVFTSLRAGGHTAAEIDDALFQNHVRHPADLVRFQQLKPESTVDDTLNSLIREDPQHPPLYFVTARWWMQTFGDSIAASRALPAVISLCSLPLFWLLAMELFRSRLTATVALALLALSPWDILFAQTARQYSLLTLAVIASSWLLLLALRRQDRAAWLGYALALAIGFYTHPLFILAVMAQGLYLLLWSWWQRSAAPGRSGWRGWRGWLHWPTVRWASLAFLICALLYIPWALVLSGNHEQATSVTSWTKTALPLGELSARWVLNITSLFVDWDTGGVQPVDIRDPLGLVPRVAILLLIGLACVQLVRHTRVEVWAFVLLLACVPFLLLAAPDLLFGGVRSATARYLIPAYPGVQLAMAFLVARQLQIGGRRGALLAGLLFIAAVASITASTLADTWWSKSTSYHNAAVAERINSVANQPVLADRGDNWMNKGQLISIAQRLRPEVALWLVTLPPDLDAVPRGAPLWVYQPSATLSAALTRAGWQLAPVDDAPGLWQAQPLVVP